MTPSFENLGKVVVEKDGEALIAMFPDGTVKAFADARKLERAARKWFEAKTTGASIGEIEWPADRWPGRPAARPPSSENFDFERRPRRCR